MHLAESLWILFGLVTGCVYALMQLFFSLGVIKLKPNQTRPLQNYPSASVIIPMRNEEDNILATLQSLQAQDYQGSFQVICIDDRSSDSSAELVRQFQAQNPHMHLDLLQIAQDAPVVKSPKKRALELGFNQAQGEILMTLDADCTPPKGWISSMAMHFSRGADIVQGPKKIRSPQGVLEGYQALDTLGFTLIEGAFFAWKMPMLASAPSLAYRKSIYEKAGGFQGLEDLESGDDDMLVQKMAALTDRVCYNLDPKAQVATVPASTWKEALLQRARWSSNGTDYPSKAYVALLMAIFGFFCWIALSPLLSLVGVLAWKYTALGWAAKAMVDTLLILSGAIKLCEFKLLRWYLHAQIIQPYMIVLAVPLGQLKLYKWK